MDVSLEYIKQCEKATEIQALRDSERDGDFYLVGRTVFDSYKEDIECTCHDVFEEYAKKSSTPSKPDEYYTRIIWIPRQDQLQEMVGGHPLELLDKFYTFCMWDERFEEMREKLSPITMEQLWLAFVMKQKYGKALDSNKEEWVK